MTFHGLWRAIRLFPLATTILAQACSLKMPAGFWRSFDSKSITREINDQGPYGGHRAIFWQGIGAAKFNLVSVIEFATKNGWKFKDSSRFTLTEVQRWRYFGKTIFPLSSEGFEPSGSYSNSEYSYFPLSTTSDIEIITFETNWTKVEPGSGKETNAFGYVVLNKDHNQMAVYHLWGD
jgi:hypothetical protein